MEELRKLEKVQRMIKFMDSKNLLTSSSSNSSNRFLANLFLFLLEPCGEELRMNDKFCLVSNLMSNLSDSVLEEASLWLTQDLLTKEENSGFEQKVVGNALPCCDQIKEYSFSQSCNENMAMVGLDSMQRANSTLEDFLDKWNENLLPTSTNAESVSGGKDEEATQFLVSYSNDPIKPLVTLLERKDLLTERITEELRHGVEYWALERKLCFALINGEEILVEDVMKAIHLKSFDYRVLNLLLYQLRGAMDDVLENNFNILRMFVRIYGASIAPSMLPEELHMEFLSISEFLVEVSDDLYDYEDDVLENNFNILRMFVRIYGASIAPSMLAKCISEAEDKYKTLLESLDPQLSLSYRKRCEEATREGGQVSEHPLGAWTIPTVIVDEEMYRSKKKETRERRQNNLKKKPNICYSRIFTITLVGHSPAEISDTGEQAGQHGGREPEPPDLFFLTISVVAVQASVVMQSTPPYPPEPEDVFAEPAGSRTESGVGCHQTVVEP
ncbi:hypothetical protein TanjilG_25202 [Lupinus angustifolius]|uniref:Uncharacterized protein n=1 Tax=Lupinus angustifolius TaxID=3871 RepID=A0A1J7GL08_LUPAN|nr:hypothetical protein TanjilG_25202 [Lupinus angustifolius]